ncbi:hypothetical protein M979_4418 [Buttiauxella noackiae ATCC 51607]|uniref:Transposase n=1 Tax=Buttiauxella noackiae ATCC 51607 TaxID=1354255 RepID=A0A1B7HG76_9ENTR|nr:hypothetical protein M979_4418 [Buttiauxella noackiae ATCC 51607]
MRSGLMSSHSRLHIDSSGLKVCDEGEWKVKKYGQEKRLIWMKIAPAGERRYPRGYL